ncbi:MAG TPA: type II toxin-antitoxin system VapC family toxin [Rhodanobacteraceae bacterium]|nr:type II toxin-antitoxin system VapC family toxin [Rhodanobacteraceae bacterium]
MRGFLIDTCVLSDATQVRPSARVTEWLDAKSTESLFLSVISVGEIEQGIARLGPTARARRLSAWLMEAVLPQFESRILSVDQAVALRWGQIRGAATHVGRPLVLVDSLIAATALEHDLSIVTRNIKDFSALDIPLINPWL